jgi:hypothetical protein
MHANLVNEVRLRTFEPGGPLGTGITEFVTGPVATNTYSKEIDEALRSPGAGDLVASLFFRPQPPRGIGALCAATDVYSYAQVTVSARRLTVALKDLNGRTVRDKLDATCGPYSLEAR